MQKSLRTATGVLFLGNWPCRIPCHSSFVILSAILLSGLSLRAAEVSPSLAVTAAHALIERVVPKQAKQFVVETISTTNGQDVFEIESRDGKIILRGNNGVSIASAFNRYLKEFCHCDVSWDCGDQLALPKPLPVLPGKLRVVSPHQFRFAFNYCTHGYTMAWWNWDRWEHELDVLALNGVNLALVIEGQEQVWINTLTQFGYTEAEARQWLVLPTHQPWMFMSNMQDYGGPLSPSLTDQRAKLAQQIITRMHELGMEPVLQGYYGIVPADFGKRHAEAKVHPQGGWGDLKRPDMLEPTDPLFTKVAETFYREQTKLYGKANFLAADPFHEGGSTDGIDLAACGRAIYQPMNGATWVLQSWQANPRQPMIDALDKNKLLVLDLWCEAQENWRARTNFNGTPWLWCTIHNFGGNVGLGGRLAWVADEPAKVLTDPARGRYSGIGALMEGSGTVPALWEIFFENSWRSTTPDLDVWLNDYAHRRYGAKIPAAEAAWKILAETVYNSPASRLELPVNSAVCARPSLKPDLRARAYVTAESYYDTTRLVEAWKLLLDAAPQAKASDGYCFDLADVGRQVLADLGTRYHRQIVAAYQAKDTNQLQLLSRKMLGLIRDMDQLTGTQREWLLGRWLADARQWGATPEEKDRYECDARELITTWTSSDSIPDYANRQWNGMLGEFYHHRWQMWLDALSSSLTHGIALDEDATRNKIRDWELAWTRQHDRFLTEPHGDVVAISQKLFKKYEVYAAGTKLKLENKSIAWECRSLDGKLQPVSVGDKLNGKTLPLSGDCFELVLGDGTVLKSSDFHFNGTPEVKALKRDRSSTTLARHFPGKELVAQLSAPEHHLSAEWRVLLREGSTYVRQELTLHAMGADVLVKEIVLFEQKVPGAKTSGTVDGSPVVAGDFFFGYEHPMSQNTVDSNDVVQCSFPRNAVLKSGETLVQSCVIGVVPDGQLRRGFQTYVERERAHRYRTFLHYNSWYDIAWIDRKYDAAQCLDVINQFGQELSVKRGVKLDSFLFDDGWDDNKTLWEFHSGFPNGFIPLNRAAAKYGSDIGVWLSPFGGYAETKAQRLKFGSQFGFETNASGFSLAGPKYYQRFHDICLEMVRKYGVNQFKFDGLAAGAKAGESGLTRDGDAMLRLVADLRKADPNIYINQTTGTWPSPFWLLYVDSTWRGGGDHWFAGKGSWCQQWLTYRDVQTYQNVVERGPLYPLNSIMLHGIIYATNAVHLNSMSDADFADQVRSFFGNGTQLQELYITPRLLNKQNWDDLAEAAKWSRANADVLVDTHWIGGNPAKGEVYGWASWSPRKGILVLRNPDDKPATFTADVKDLFQLPPHAKANFKLHSPWKQDRKQPSVNLKAGEPHTFTLKPFEVLVLESK
ncbi:MAG TPA: alpha-N-acetylglucosaminidase TIM-barrel domain-containing protein [bacterium]|nr:alpha-N-acetylglucosaminidase TIM-barrel domain-containing protein [bacterium]